MSYWIPDFRRWGFVELSIMRMKIGSFFYINGSCLVWTSVEICALYPDISRFEYVSGRFRTPQIVNFTLQQATKAQWREQVL